MAGGLPYYRDALDHQREDQMIWQPYTEAVLSVLPEICWADRHIWRTRAPLICYDIVELHCPDRVLRQFGLMQSIPAGVDTSDALHRKDRRRKSNWLSVHSSHIEDWNRRQQLVVHGRPWVDSAPEREEYIRWYRSVTRLIITPPTHQPPPSHYQPATTDLVLARAMAEMHLRLTTATQSTADLPADSAFPLLLQSVDSVASYMGQTLTSVGQSHLLQHPDPQSTPQFGAGSSSGSRQRQVRPTQRPFRPPTFHDSPLSHPPPRPPPRRPPHSSSRPQQPPPRPPPDVPSPPPFAPSPPLFVPSPPPIQYTYRRSRQRHLDDIEENVDEGASSSSSAARGKRDRRS